MILAPLAFLSLALAQQAAPIAELEFELVGGRPYVAAKVNGRDASAIVDTGAAATVIDVGVAEEWGLESQGDIDARGTGSRSAKGKILRNARAVVGGIAETIGYAIPLGGLSQAEGRRLEVVIGHPFFESHVVELDYAKRRLRVFDGAADVAAKGTVIPIRIVGNRPRATVRVLVAGEEHVGDAMVDTGATTTSLAAAFRREHPFDVRTTPKVVVGGGVGGFIEGRYFRPDAVMLGPLEFRRPILSMVEAEEGISDEKDPIDVLLASDLLRRSRVTFDYARFRMTLEPNTDFAAPFEADKSGLQIQARAGEAKAFEIVGVLPGSAADEAGVRVGDVLESVDGAPVSSFTLTRLRDAFRSATSTKWELGLRRGEKRIRVTVPAKSVI